MKWRNTDTKGARRVAVVIIVKQQVASIEVEIANLGIDCRAQQDRVAARVNAQAVIGDDGGHGLLIAMLTFGIPMKYRMEILVEFAKLFCALPVFSIFQPLQPLYPQILHFRLKTTLHMPLEN